MCPIQLHLLLWICKSMGSYLVLSHKSTLLTLSLHQMFSILLKQVLMNVCSLYIVFCCSPCFWSTQHHLLHVEVKDYLMVSIEICFELQIFMSMLNTTLAYWSCFLCWHRYVNASTSSRAVLCMRIGLLVLEWILAILGVRTSFVAAYESLSVFSCICICVCESRASHQQSQGHLAAPTLSTESHFFSL